MAKDKEEHEQTPEEKGLRRGGVLTHKGMEEVIKGGGSVIHRGQLIAKVEDLPDEATLLEGDREAAAAATAALDAQIASLSAQRSAIEKAGKEAPKAAPPKAGEHGHGR